jgi:hypothetical protein
MMWGCDRLGLGRPLLAQNNRQHHDRAERQKFALLVLKRLEPETRSAYVFQHRNCLPAVLQLLLIVLINAAGGMQDKGDNKQHYKGQKKRIFVECQP